MDQWTEQKAIKMLNSNANINIDGSHISCYGGLHGLKACSALDYLCDHCGYQVDKMTVETPEAKRYQ